MRLATLALAVSTTSALAQADRVGADDPAALLQLMRDAGVKSSLGIDGWGDPTIEARSGDVAWEVLFHGCTDGAGCTNVMFAAGFASPGATPDRVNEWNAAQLYSRAFVDDTGEAVLELPINTTGGISTAAFSDGLDWWLTLLPEFRDHVQ
ncbi:YbjN domain-containing protein [Jannaschia sp. Os4]|uniref:YbjN domain-containing protein n=1 Tax=Jannaschia sp. Os4 TaxID=2807617 RepID=UPI00193A6494|nr:YbjN domain-containing protein [Jannaschia sp. Os4]MBM2577839.1 YbjN domain-containing protein [Jannaschia sp. Os4]